MQELERREAVVLSIELWSWLKETGGKKEDWPGWDRNGGQHRSNTNSLCFLCEYVIQKIGVPAPSLIRCEGCPFREMFGYCADKGTFYYRWSEEKDKHKKAVLAGQFLNLLKEVLSTMPKGKWGEKEEKPKQFIIFDDAGYLAGSGCLEDEVIKGEEALIEKLEELGKDNPDTIKDYKVFKMEPVCFNVSPATVAVTLDCDC